MKLKLTSNVMLTIAFCCCCMLVLLQEAKGIELSGRRIKRQSASRGRLSDKQQMVALGSANGGGGSMAMATATSTMMSSSAGQMKPTDSEPTGSSGNERPQPRPPKTRKPPAGNQNHDEEEDDCGRDGESYDGPEDYDYGNFFSMAANPMRHFSRMMNNVFSQMEPNFDEERMSSPGRSSVSSSSAFSGNNGNSRLSSSVSNNGRTRGIIMETRDGRTRTRQFGDRDDETDFQGSSNN